jgi:hypothetical protein
MDIKLSSFFDRIEMACPKPVQPIGSFFVRETGELARGAKSSVS